MELKSWEGAHLLPSVPLERCSWCRKHSEQCYVVLFENTANNADPTMIESEVVCKSCSRGAEHYISLRKSGVSRKMVLRDFGIRNEQNKPDEWIFHRPEE